MLSSILSLSNRRILRGCVWEAATAHVCTVLYVVNKEGCPRGSGLFQLESKSYIAKHNKGPSLDPCGLKRVVPNTKAA